MQKRAISVALVFIATFCQAQTKVTDSLLRIVARHTGDTIEMKALDALSGEYMRVDMDKTIGFAKQELAVARAIGHLNGMSLAYATIVPMYQTTGRLDSARYYIDRFDSLYKKHPSNKKVGINYNNTAGLYYKNLGHFREAQPYLLEALRLIGPDGDKTNQAGQMLNIGNNYINLGDLKNAAAYHLKALALFELVNNKRGQSFCLQSLGADFLALKQFAVAEKYTLQAEKLKEELGDRRGLLSAWMKLGELYQQTGKPELSLYYSRKALARARELKLTMEEVPVLYSMGLALKATKKMDDAANAFRQAMTLARQAGDSLVVSRIQSQLVTTTGDRRKEKGEEKTLVQGIEVAFEKGDRSGTAEGHQKLAQWYADHNQFKRAFENLSLAQQVNDSVRGRDVIMQLNELEENYKSEKKEREIIVLKKDQELKALELSRQKLIIVSIGIALISVVVIGILLVNRYRVMNRVNRALEIERMRNTIARDLHDDIGSALSSINILSQVAQVERNGEAHNYLQRIGDQSARIMESMDDMVWSIHPGNDSMEQVIIRMREVVTELLDPKNIEYHIKEDVASKVTIGADERRNLFLIFKEAVNNAAKYSRATQVEINLYQRNHTLVLSVHDNGQGFDDQAIQAGNGLRNMRERAQELGGTVSIKSTNLGGTEIEVQFPIA